MQAWLLIKLQIAGTWFFCSMASDTNNQTQTIRMYNLSQALNLLDTIGPNNSYIGTESTDDKTDDYVHILMGRLILTLSILFCKMKKLLSLPHRLPLCQQHLLLQQTQTANQIMFGIRAGFNCPTQHSGVHFWSFLTARKCLRLLIFFHEYLTDDMLIIYNTV